MMQKLILVDPSINLPDRFGKLARAGSLLPSLGLCSLAAVARGIGYRVKIIDANLHLSSLPELVDKIFKEKPSWVGFSATTLTIDLVGEIAEKIKKKSSGVTVLVGGAHVTAVPRQTLKKYSSIDMGVIGEGEETLKELLKTKNPKKVKGLVLREGKRLILTGSRPFLKDLDSLPLPAWDLLPGFPEKYTPSVNSYHHLPAAHLVTSRGCTGQCLFCDRSVFGRTPRMHSAQRVLEMIDHLIRNYGVKEIQFFDDNFLLFPKRLEEICRGLIKSGWGLSWSCQARADMVNPKALSLMKKAGCWQMGLGIESGSDKILKILKKGETVDLLKKKVEEIARVGIEVKGFFILGNPGETKETLEQTRDFILSTDLTYAHTTYFTPFPGSEAFKVAEKFGRLEFKNIWSKLGRGTIEPVFVPRGLSTVVLKNSAKEIFRKFYFRPKIVYYFLRRILLLPRLWPAYFKGLLSVVSFAQNND
ncbi:B12-binding domain-containing radical SAM protein [Patescibacteria group bacterium]